MKANRRSLARRVLIGLLSPPPPPSPSLPFLLLSLPSPSLLPFSPPTLLPPPSPPFLSPPLPPCLLFPSLSPCLSSPPCRVRVFPSPASLSLSTFFPLFPSLSPLSASPPRLPASALLSLLSSPALRPSPRSPPALCLLFRPSLPPSVLGPRLPFPPPSPSSPVPALSPALRLPLPACCASSLPVSLVARPHRSCSPLPRSLAFPSPPPPPPPSPLPSPLLSLPALPSPPGSLACGSRRERHVDLRQGRDRGTSEGLRGRGRPVESRRV